MRTTMLAPAGTTIGGGGGGGSGAGGGAICWAGAWAVCWPCAGAIWPPAGAICPPPAGGFVWAWLEVSVAAGGFWLCSFLLQAAKLRSKIALSTTAEIRERITLIFLFWLCRIGMRPAKQSNSRVRTTVQEEVRNRTNALRLEPDLGHPKQNCIASRLVLPATGIRQWPQPFPVVEPSPAPAKPGSPARPQ